MGIRYRKKVKVTDGLSVNLSKTGVSFSAKMGRATHNFGHTNKKYNSRTTINLSDFFKGLSYVVDHKKERSTEEDTGSPWGSLFLLIAIFGGFWLYFTHETIFWWIVVSIGAWITWICVKD